MIVFGNSIFKEVMKLNYVIGIIQCDWCPYKKRLGTDIHREKDCVKTEGKELWISQGERCEVRQPRQHIGLSLPASRAVRRGTFVVQATQPVVFVMVARAN